ncbi:FtsX-like permease family protein [uncultured Actinomyces sp.]|uniref:ABC transporter permease n=1 Tax=uncultured Actinomyces sp. TaxID=249061 RepID=UPI0028D9041E|nr:FtsX-like permease family protein [uncultured Actinomyces sp.]
MSSTSTLLRANLRTHGRRYFSTGLAVAISTAFIIVTLLFTNTTTSALTRSIREAYRGTTALVTIEPSRDDNAEEPTPEGVTQQFASVTSQIEKIPGVTAVGISTQYPLMGKAHDERDAFFLSPLLPDPFLSLKYTQGKAPATASEITIPSTSAKELGLQVGETLTLTSQGTESAHDFTVSGIYDSGSNITATSYVSTEGFTSAVGMGPTGQIRVATNLPGDKYGNPTAAEQDTWVKTLESNLSTVKGVKVQSAASEIEQQLKSIQVSGALLTAIALIFPAIAILVASVVVSSTFKVILQQRRRELALLRALGADVQQVRSLVRRETYAIGGISSLVGIVLGLLLGGLLNTITEDTSFIDAISSISPLYVVLVWLFGTLLTVFVGRKPARAVSQVPPIAALSPVNEADASSRAARRLTLVVGLFLAVVGGGCLLAALKISSATQKFALSFCMSMACLIGILLICTVIVPTLTKLFGRLWPGMLARMARENAVRNPGRTSATGTSIVIGVTLVVTMMVGASSMRDSLINEVNERRPFDLSVSTITAGELSSDIQARVSSTEGVAASIPAHSIYGTVKLEGEAPAGNGDADEQSQIFGEPNYSTVAHSKVEQIDDSTVLVGMEAWNGKDLKVCTNEGKCLTLKGKYTKNFNGTYEVSEANLLKLNPKAPVRDMIVKLKDGVSAASVQKDLAKIDNSLSVNGSALEREMYSKMIDQMLLIVVGLLGVSVLVALVGVANTLSLSVAERTRENGLLRALGLTKRQMKTMLALEAVFISVTGAIIGSALGIFFGAVGILALPLEGLTIFITIPWIQIAAVIGIAVLASLVASWFFYICMQNFSPSGAFETYLETRFGCGAEHVCSAPHP